MDHKENRSDTFHAEYLINIKNYIKTHNQEIWRILWDKPLNYFNKSFKSSYLTASLNSSANIRTKLLPAFWRGPVDKEKSIYDPRGQIPFLNQNYEH